MFMIAARFASWSQATSGQWLNGADFYVHSTHARPQITNSAIATFASRYAALSTSGSNSHSRVPNKILYSEGSVGFVALSVWTSLVETLHRTGDTSPLRVHQAESSCCTTFTLHHNLRSVEGLGLLISCSRGLTEVEGLPPSVTM